jgi:hypothetical protein
MDGVTELHLRIHQNADDTSRSAIPVRTADIQQPRATLPAKTKRIALVQDELDRHALRCRKPNPLSFIRPILPKRISEPVP